ncbi:MAG TPA: transporter, partial [Thermoanaerobaculia bacterium]|nr:transporter [Thermoanaerobaculia bacterium]
FLAPTGRFEAGAADNVGSGYWTHVLASGQTVYLTEDKRTAVSAFQMYEFHTTQEGTGIHPGETFDLDYSLMGSLRGTGNARIQLGIVGYEARQTTARTGPGVSPEATDERYAVNAVGIAVSTGFTKPRAGLSLRYFREFSNRSTFQGYSLQLSGSIAL